MSSSSDSHVAMPCHIYISPPLPPSPPFPLRCARPASLLFRASLWQRDRARQHWRHEQRVRPSRTPIRCRLRAGTGLRPGRVRSGHQGAKTLVDAQTLECGDSTDGPALVMEADAEALARVLQRARLQRLLQVDQDLDRRHGRRLELLLPHDGQHLLSALDAIANDLAVSVGLINLTLTTYMICQAIAPTLFGDFGDMAGRRPAFLVAFTIYLGANIGLALQDNFARPAGPAHAAERRQQWDAGSWLRRGRRYLGQRREGKYMGYVGAGITSAPPSAPSSAVSSPSIWAGEPSSGSASS